MSYFPVRSSAGVLLASALSWQAAFTRADAPATRPQSPPLPVGVFKNLNAGRPQTVVVYGTSLTAGGAWTKSLKDYFDTLYPGRVTFVNAAKNGMHSDWGVENFKSRVLEKRPDLVFIEFAVNDASTKNKVSLEKSVANLDAMVRALRRQNPNADVVLQTMNPAWDSPRVPEKKYGTDRPNLRAYYDGYRTYATQHGLPLVDHAPAWQKLAQDDRERFEKMVPDGIHPSSTASVAVTWAAVQTMLDGARAAAE